MKRKFEYSRHNVIGVFVVALVFAIMGFIFVSMSNRREDDYRKKKRIYEKTVAQCVDNDREEKRVRRKKRTRTETNYYAIYEYAVNDQTYRHKSTVSSSFRTSIGKRVQIYYNPDNPRESFTDKEINSNRRIQIIGEVFMFLGIAVAMANSIWIIYNKKNGKSCC